MTISPMHSGPEAWGIRLSRAYARLTGIRSTLQFFHLADAVRTPQTSGVRDLNSFRTQRRQNVPCTSCAYTVHPAASETSQSCHHYDKGGSI